MIRSSSLVQRSIALYDAALRLYPRPFQRHYGPLMRDAFCPWLIHEARERGTLGVLTVWRVTARELLPTLVREHVSETTSRLTDFTCVYSIHHIFRIALAVLVTLAAYFAFLHFGRTPVDFAVISFWFALTAAEMVRARGRRWACNRNGMIGSAAGIGFPLAWTALTENSSPSVAIVAPLLIATAAAVALILSSLIRLIVEGISHVAPVRVASTR